MSTGGIMVDDLDAAILSAVTELEKQRAEGACGMSEKKTTPRPWRAQDVEFSEDTWLAFLNEEGMRCVTARGNIVAVTWDTEDDDNPEQKDQFNAALIVEAVNNYDRLKAENERLRDGIENALASFNDRECNCDGEYENGRLVGHTCYFHRIEHDLREALERGEGG